MFIPTCIAGGRCLLLPKKIFCTKETKPKKLIQLICTVEKVYMAGLNHGRENTSKHLFRMIQFTCVLLGSSLVGDE